MINKPTIICLTPVKNEDWIIEKFLRATSLWAEYIILADQNSTDRTVEIAEKFKNVVVVRNDKGFDEAHRQKILIDEARKLDKSALLIALDADEFFTANFHKSNEWHTLITMPKGSVGAFKRLDVHPDFKHLSYSPSFYGQWAFMDDGSDHFGKAIIHSHRIPLPKDATHYHFNDIAVLHYTRLDEKRVSSKNRWYLCLERLKNNDNSLNLYKKYGTSQGFSKGDSTRILFEPHYLDYYFENKIDMTSFSFQCKHIERLSGSNSKYSHQLFPYYWWDVEVLDLIEKHGINTFAQLDIWSYNWQLLAYSLGNRPEFKVKRSFFDRLALLLIRELGSEEKLSLIQKIKLLFLKIIVK